MTPAPAGDGSARLWAGLTAPGRGLAVIARNEGLWPYAIGPVVIAATLVTAAIALALSGAGSVTAWLLPGLHPQGPLFALGQAAVLVLLLVVGGLTATMTAALLCIPVHDALGQRIEALEGALPAPLSFWEAMPASITHSVLGFLLWLGLEALLVPLQLLPAIGWLIELVGGFGITFFFLGHQLLDGPMSRRNMGFAEKLRWMRAHLPAVLGIGATGTLMVAIPVVSWIGLPVAMAGGTILWLEIEGSVASEPAEADPA